MSDTSIQLFRPRVFLIAFAIGLIGCALLGRWVSSRDYHRTFTRFHVRLSPEAHYYPTIEEMRSIVRARCRPDQTLVIVGGNSIFHGVGQPVGKIWTEELQRLLGPDYVVINFALRGALCTDGGAYVAESLRKEFPRQIYVANTSPFSPPVPYGIEPYRYLFWQARTRGLLQDFAPRDRELEVFLKRDFTLGARFELLGSQWFDRVLRFRDLWNWVGFHYLFTIQNPHTPSRPQATWPRRNFKDEEGDFELIPLRERFTAAARDAEMEIVRGFSETHAAQSPSGWTILPKSRQEFVSAAQAAVPDDLKARTLIMLSRNSPIYLNQLAPDEREREEFVYREGVEAWRALGYRSLDYGADYAPVDFGDRTHLTASGGRKLARQVADEVLRMAVALGYEREK